MVKGFIQTCIDFVETFAAIAQINSVRVLLSCVANLRWELQQFDPKHVFLSGDLKREVYLEIPPSFVCNTGLVDIQTPY